MTTYEAYIGDLDNWYHNGPLVGGKTPGDLCWLPDRSPGTVRQPFFWITELIANGKLPGEQTDWGCWVAIASRDELLRLLDEWYGDGPILHSELDRRRNDPDVRQVVSELDPKKKYGLVAYET